MTCPGKHNIHRSYKVKINKMYIMHLNTLYFYNNFELLSVNYDFNLHQIFSDLLDNIQSN